MLTRYLGALKVSEQGLGCMGMSEFYGDTNREESLATLERAFALGVNFFDTADGYGFGANEELLGEFIKKHNREDLILATKCGIVRDKNVPTKRGINNQSEYIKLCCENSLNRLQTNYIDLYYLHRINEDNDGQGAPLETSMQAFADLLLQGRIKYVGLSEASCDQIQRAHDALLKHTHEKHGLTAVQSEYSLLTRTPELDGVLDICKKMNIGFVAYSPLSRQLLTTAIQDTNITFSAQDFRSTLPRFSKTNLVYNLEVIAKIKEFANKKSCTVAALAIAWVMARRNYIVPIPGTKRIKYLEENLSASKVHLSQEDLLELDKLVPPSSVIGERYTEAAMKLYHLKS